MRPLTFLSFGSNLGNTVGHCMGAIMALQMEPRAELLLLSSLYESAPLGVDGRIVDHPPYLNGVVGLRWHGTPKALLEALQAIEDRHGRERPYPCSPRTLDLDILLMGEWKIVEEDLQIPHPRVVGRRFVLLPLVEVAGRDLVLPGADLTAGEALERLSPRTQPVTWMGRIPWRAAGPRRLSCR